MANYVAFTRTNYFKVNNPIAFKELIERAVTTEDDGLELFEKKSEDGTMFYGFGTYGGIVGIADIDDDEYGRFLEELQTFVMPGDAIIITEVGYENLRYLSGLSTIITCDSIAVVNLYDETLKKVRSELGDEKYLTRFEY